ncbi:hypothetical protein V6N11_070457 [Hibiscus sabdariffa]|uniref:Uncharacterized protein n=1 Tax=Hibiscus sabdariffa TaxID=183260 RepID=A0ABR2QF05_9ROSI
MAKMDKVNVNELLQAQAHVWNHIFNFINSMSLKCAVDLGIPDIIHNHGKPMTVTELVAALPTLDRTKAGNIYRLMRILVHSEFFGVEEDGYVLTNASRLLLKDDPLSLTPFVESMLDPMLTKPWDYLSVWFQNKDRTPFDTAHGKAFWEYGFHDPKLGTLFNQGLATDSRTGTVCKAIADAFPHLECTVLDSPQVVAGLQDCGNLKYVGGNMLEEVPPADAALIKWVLHDWNDDECVKILKQCKKAISGGKDGGKVIIIDIVLKRDGKGDDEDSNMTETQLGFDMVAMALLGGKEREEEEWAKLFFSAGFSDYKITHVIDMRSVIEVYP